MPPPGIEPRPTDSESDLLTTLPSMYMALTRDQAQNLVYLSATPTKTKIIQKRRSAETLTRRLRPE